MKKNMTEKEVEQMLENFNPKEAHKRQNAKREAILNDPANAEMLAEVRERRAIVEALHKARKEAKLTQAEIAERMNVSQPYVAKLERGRGAIGWTAISKYAAACGKRVSITLL